MSVRGYNACADGHVRCPSAVLPCAAHARCAIWARLSDLLAREETTDAFMEVEERALHLKVALYDQFLPALDRVGVH
ncbi:hypothetical protein [Streptomyces pseudoechinosporeus]